jgi:integrase/DNA-binding transcriptional regulator YhcF (GntR family)
VLPSGARRVRVFAGYDTLSRKRNYLVETVPPGPNVEREVEKVRTRLLNDINERRNPRTNATLRQLIEHYFEVANLDPGTLRGYRRNYENHVKPLIGKTKVGSVDAQLLDSFYAELRRCRAHCDKRKRIDHRTTGDHICDNRCGPHKCEPLASSTIRRVHFLLSGAFKRAVRWGWITSNPASSAEPPAEPTPSPRPPSPAEAAKIVNAAWADPEWGTFIWLAMTTGARRAELCALRWHDLDLELGTISIHRSIDQYGTETNEKDTKTHQHRRIALDTETMSVLSEHRTRWEDRVAELESDLSNEAFVFSLAPDGSTPLKPDTVTQRYGRLVSRLDISTTIHKLRHFSATELITAGVDPRTVGGRLGHAGGGSTTLRVYSAWVAESDQRAAGNFATRMPARPTSSERAELAKLTPMAPFEKIAARIRKQILNGELPPGSPAPAQQEIGAKHHVSAGTANRVVELLKEWNLVETSRGRRAVVLTPPHETPQREAAAARAPVEPAEAAPRVATESPAPIEPIEGEGSTLLELRLVCLGKTVRTFTSDANPSDATHIRRLLRNAVRRLGGESADLADYELEVRKAGSTKLITTYAAL